MKTVCNRVVDVVDVFIYSVFRKIVAEIENRDFFALLGIIPIFVHESH